MMLVVVRAVAVGVGEGYPKERGLQCEGSRYPIVEYLGPVG